MRQKLSELYRPKRLVDVVGQPAVLRVIVDTTMSWAEFKRRATKLAAPSLF